MTNLKTLLDQAAGEPAGLGDAELEAFLARGRRAVRRRRWVTTGAVAAVTAGVVLAGSIALPGRDLGAPITGNTPTPTQGITPFQPDTGPATGLPPLPSGPSEPVGLEPDGTRHPGVNIVCDLRPAGWQTRARPVVQRVGDIIEKDHVVGTIGGGSLWTVDPAVERPTAWFDYLKVGPTGFVPDTGGKQVVYGTEMGWNEFEHHRAGPYEAIVTGSLNNRPPTENDLRTIMVRVGPNALISVSITTRLGWDLKTALRFAGSCRIVR